jgi:putative ABC transport system ATP-binding protein
MRNVTKVYGMGATQFQALKGVDLDIEAGDFVAVMGPSGSGKSTTMNILGCLDVPSGGTFLFRGHHVETLDRDQRALLRRRYLGFVFQGFNLLSRTSALENVELPLLYRVLLADEPTGNLDSERSVEIMELLTDLNRTANITVLMVTHEPDMAAFARTVVHFKDGLVERIEAQYRQGEAVEA